MSSLLLLLSQYGSAKGGDVLGVWGDEELEAEFRFQTLDEPDVQGATTADGTLSIKADLHGKRGQLVGERLMDTRQDVLY